MINKLLWLAVALTLPTMAAAQTPQTPSPPALHPLPLPKSFEIVAPPLVEMWR